jgi:erythritol kinase
MPLPVPGAYAQIQSNMASTLNIDWILEIAAGILADQGLERSRADLIARLDHWIAAAKPAALLYQPYISEAGERGPFVDGNARAGFIGLSVRHGFADLVRAVVEGLAFASRDCYGAMGHTPSEIRLTGGAARSRELRAIHAAAVGAPVRTSSREEAGAAGAAMMAAVAIGAYPDMASCVDHWVTPRLGPIEAPDDELTGVYARAYPAYAAAHVALRPIWKTLATTRGRAL